MKALARITAAATVLVLGTGLLVAAPAQAAVKVPAGCTSGGQKYFDSLADVTDIQCDTLANGMDFSGYRNLTSLHIGYGSVTAKKLTVLPKLPTGLTELQVDAPNVTGFSSLRPLKKLRTVSLQTRALSSFDALKASRSSLQQLELSGNYWGRNLSPLSGYPKLTLLNVRSTGSHFTATRGIWTKPGFAKGLDGKYLLPERYSIFIVETQKYAKSYDFNAASGKMRYQTSGLGNEPISKTLKPSSKQPKLRGQLEFNRKHTVHDLAQWSRDSKNTIVISGVRAPGHKLTARHKSNDPDRQYVDKYQWLRNRKPIKGATKSSYTLKKADLGRRITLKATDSSPDGMYVNWPGIKYVPVSRTFSATNKVLQGFKTYRPAVKGNTFIGSTLRVSMKSWAPKPTRLSYQWMRQGNPIKGATKSSYKLVGKDQLMGIAVKVSGSRKGHATMSATSYGVLAWRR